MNEEVKEKALALYHQSKEIEEKLDFIEHQLIELREFNIAIEGLDMKMKDNTSNYSEKNEMLASIGKGVYIKTKMESGGNFFVNVGAGIIVRKKSGDLKKVIKSQVSNLGEIRGQLRAYLAPITYELRDMANIDFGNKNKTEEMRA